MLNELRQPTLTYIELNEYEERLFPELTAEQATLLQAEFGNYITVGRNFDGDWLLKAKQFVGIISLPGLQIDIRPKVPLNQLFYMLTYAYDLPPFRDEEVDLAVNNNLFEFLVQIFIQQVDLIVRRGLYRNYLDREENHAFLRGRLMVNEQLRRNVIMAQRFYQRTNQFTPDLLENRILQYTLWQLARRDYKHKDLRPHLRRALTSFAEVTPAAVKPSDCERILYTRLNQRYEPAIKLAQILLQHLSFSARRGDGRFFAYLFDMPTLFETFVTRYLQKHLTIEGEQITVSGQYPIHFDDERTEPGRPDIVILRDGRPLLVIDCKYKAFWDEWERGGQKKRSRPGGADRNQMFIYAQRLGVETAVLLYPTAHRPYVRNYPGGVRLQTMAIPLDQEVGRFAEFVAEVRGMVREGILTGFSG